MEVEQVHLDKVRDQIQKEVSDRLLPPGEFFRDSDLQALVDFIHEDERPWLTLKVKRPPTPDAQ